MIVLTITYFIIKIYFPICFLLKSKNILLDIFTFIINKVYCFYFIFKYRVVFIVYKYICIKCNYFNVNHCCNYDLLSRRHVVAFLLPQLLQKTYTILIYGGKTYLRRTLFSGFRSMRCRYL